MWGIKDQNILFDGIIINVTDYNYKSVIEDTVNCFKYSNSPHGYANIT